MTPLGKNRFLSLEIGRFLAALSVALFHYTTAIHDFRGDLIFAGFFRFGHIGVEYFFLLSGFLIYHIHIDDINNRSGFLQFIQKRFIRIYPTYWCVATLILILVLAIPQFSAERSISPADIPFDFLLVPFRGQMLVPVSWSLRHEIVFYVIFSAALLLGRRGLILFVAWQAICAGHLIAFPSTSLRGDSIETVLFGVHNLGFGLGVAAAAILRCTRIRSPRLWIGVGTASVAALALYEWRQGTGKPILELALGDPWSPLIYYPAFFVLFLGLVGREVSHPSKAGPFTQILGSSSYVMYLTHGLVGAVVIRAMSVGVFAQIPSVVVFFVMVLGAVFSAALIHLWAEKPALKWLGRLVANRNSAAPPSHPS